MTKNEECLKSIEILNDHSVKVTVMSWNQRYKDSMIKVKTGSLIEVAAVLRELYLLKKEKELSFGERKMADFARNIILAGFGENPESWDVLQTSQNALLALKPI